MPLCLHRSPAHQLCTQTLSRAKVLQPERTQRTHRRLCEFYFRVLVIFSKQCRCEKTKSRSRRVLTPLRTTFAGFLWTCSPRLLFSSAGSRNRSRGRPRWCPLEPRPPPSLCPRRFETTNASNRTSPAAQPQRCTARQGKGARVLAGSSNGIQFVQLVIRLGLEMSTCCAITQKVSPVLHQPSRSLYLWLIYWLYVYV